MVRELNVNSLLMPGDMAKVNEISRKALRIYWEKGLIAPDSVDDKTNYRYFNITESTRIDLVKSLQVIGFSLNEIADIEKSGTAIDLQHHLRQAMKKIEEERARLDEAQSLAASLLEECAFCLDGPLLDHVILEDLPERYALEFDLSDFIQEEDGLETGELWEWVNRIVSHALSDLELPRFAIRGGGFTVSTRCESVDDCSWVKHRIVLIDRSLAKRMPEVRVFPGGPHLVLYCTNCDLSSKRNDDIGETARKRNVLLEYAASNAFEVTGELSCEEMSRIPHLLDPKVSSIYRYCLPISAKH